VAPLAPLSAPQPMRPPAPMSAPRAVTPPSPRPMSAPRTCKVGKRKLAAFTKRQAEVVRGREPRKLCRCPTAQAVAVNSIRGGAVAGPAPFAWRTPNATKISGMYKPGADISMSLLGTDWAVEVQCRATGFAQPYDWLIREQSRQRLDRSRTSIERQRRLPV
jgi:hypothetical protein